MERLLRLKGLRLFGPKTNHAGVVSFLLDKIHAHDVVTVADQYGVALRGGHHCNQPLIKRLGIDSTARASFYFYNTEQEVDRLVDVLENPPILRLINDSLTPQTTMRRVLEIFPGAQRALFRRFHIGGCASCGIQPEETSRPSAAATI